MQLNNMILVCYLLWRVETLSALGLIADEADGLMPQEQDQADSPFEAVDCQAPSRDMDGSGLSQTIYDKIGPSLQKNCIDTQLYLQHDLTVIQLARAVGTNRYYLSQYFSCQGITYNAYINRLRIDHFMSLYRQTVTQQQLVTAQQLATESGFHNYRTFSNAFKQQTGQTVTGWMKEQQGHGKS